MECFLFQWNKCPPPSCFWSQFFITPIETLMVYMFSQHLLGKILHSREILDGERKAVVLWGLGRKSKIILEGKDNQPPHYQVRESSISHWPVVSSTLKRHRESRRKRKTNKILPYFFWHYKEWDESKAEGYMVCLRKCVSQYRWKNHPVEGLRSTGAVSAILALLWGGEVTLLHGEPKYS